MGSVNKVILVGHLGRDPESRAPASMPDARIVTLNVATSEQWKDRHSGERKEKTEWHRVVIFNPVLADVAEKYLKKGSAVYIEGALQTRKWTDQQGAERFTTEVVVGRFKGELTLLGGNSGGGHRPDNEHDGYGTSRTRAPAPAVAYGGMDATGRSIPAGGGGGGWEHSEGFDDEIPFLSGADLPLGRRVP